ncbi:MAG: kynureninase [Candidatus Marinimicrobia bacterium]|nr:kynureninase [Candidatus Neomarinimicrobiota bacterium]
MKVSPPASQARARELDNQDSLAPFADRFVVQEPHLIYLMGNSLGRLPRATVSRLATAIDQEWGRDLVRGWNAGWVAAPARLGDRLGQLLGAAAGQLVLGDSTSVNLYKLVLAALALRPDRHRIVTDELNFPSDLYVLQGCVRTLGGHHRLHVVPPGHDGISIDWQRLLEAIDERTALVTLSQVAFKTGYLYDVPAITSRAHDVGALVLWDLSHSAGVVPVELDRWGVDLAVGCTYKYLNGGPGSPALLYVRQDLHRTVQTPLQGWFGHRAPFEFDPQFQPASDVTRFCVGTPAVLSLLALEPALDLLLEAGAAALHRKAQALTGFLLELFDTDLAPLGFELGTPRDPARRGAHISLRHPQAYRISRALAEEMNVLADFREPDYLRLGLSPLYTGFSHVWQAVDRIRQVVAERRYERYSEERVGVT